LASNLFAGGAALCAWRALHSVLHTDKVRRCLTYPTPSPRRTTARSGGPMGPSRARGRIAGMAPV